jgi:hypothetical protein
MAFRLFLRDELAAAGERLILRCPHCVSRCSTLPPCRSCTAPRFDASHEAFKVILLLW